MADFSQIKFNPAAYRGTFDLAPSPGSSNLTGAIPLAGGYAGLLQSPEMQATIQKDPGKLFDFALGVSALRSTDPTFQREQRQQSLQDQLAYAKAQGDQMMKYRMTNDIIANLGAAARAAFAQYTDPTAIANIYAGVGDAYARGAEAGRGLTQLGAGQPAIQYYKY